MYGNPLDQWVALGVATVVMLPLPVATMAGWTPPWLRKQRAGLRFRAGGVLCIYALVLLNAVPRIANAPIDTVLAFSKAGFGFIAVGGVLFLSGARKDSRARAGYGGELGRRQR